MPTKQETFDTVVQHLLAWGRAMRGGRVNQAYGYARQAEVAAWDLGPAEYQRAMYLVCAAKSMAGEP